MGKITSFVNVSLDGFFEGKNHDISWHNVNEEFNQFAVDMLKQTGIILFGRRTYELFEEYWPKAAGDPATSKSDLEVADLINNMEKIVFSKTLQQVNEGKNWKNVRLMREVDPEEIRDWKRRCDRDLSVGGNNLLLSFVRLGLIDEIRVMVNPVIIGEGNSLLKGIASRIKLELHDTRTFGSGNVLITYKPIPASSAGSQVPLN
jgi:dihydrofolate reductase